MMLDVQPLHEANIDTTHFSRSNQSDTSATVLAENIEYAGARNARDSAIPFGPVRSSTHGNRSAGCGSPASSLAFTNIPRAAIPDP